MHIYDRGIKTAHKNPDLSYVIKSTAYMTKGNACVMCMHVWRAGDCIKPLIQ
jgi:hypothetical protein